jgi:hypothetical protein
MARGKEREPIEFEDDYEIDLRENIDDESETEGSGSLKFTITSYGADYPVETIVGRLLGEAHLRRILTKYAAYYNELRTHRSLNKDAPIHRAIQQLGHIVSAPVLGGLHHHYCRI